MAWKNKIVDHTDADPKALIAHDKNWRIHTPQQIRALRAAISDVGFIRSVTVNRTTGRIIDGHLRVELAIESGEISIPVEWVDLNETEEAEALATMDPLSALAGTDEDTFAELRKLFDTSSQDLEQMFAGIGDATAGIPAPLLRLADRFGIPPFSVLDARSGWWQERKAAWLDSGLQSSAGRDDLLIFSESSQPPHVYRAKNSYEDSIGRKVSWQEFFEANPDAREQSGTSIFDPVLCELLYRWFCPLDGVILDPFAGGSVRGIVAANLGRKYFGIDVRPEQVEANARQWSGMFDGKLFSPNWIVGDSRQLDSIYGGPDADFVFSCPPYADLEVYSDDQADLSNMDYPEFLAAYREIVRKAIARLRQDRFACFVVGEIRDRNGIYRNFVGETIAAFELAGAQFYNEGILVTQAGSLAVRVGRQFVVSRKLGKTHQNVLVFVKGDPRAATAACGPVEFEEEIFERSAELP